MRPGAAGLLLLPVVAIVGVGYVLPGLVLVALSLGIVPARPDLATLSLETYARLLGDVYYARILGYTFLLGLIVATLTAILAFPAGYYLARSEHRLAGLFALLTFAPLAVGMNMLTLGWMIILGRTGLLNAGLVGIGIVSQPLDLLYGWTAVVIGMIHVTFTFMVLPIEAVVRGIDPSLERAARILGASPARVFLHVVLPLSLNGVAAGFLIVFLQVCGAFVLPLLLGGQDFTVVPVAIWEQMNVLSDRAFAATLSTCLIAISIVVMVVQLRVSRDRSLV